MRVNFIRVFAVAQQFKQIIISQEEEPRKRGSLRIQKTEQNFLRFLKLLRNLIKIIIEIIDKQDNKDIFLTMNPIHMRRNPLIQDLKLIDIASQLMLLVLLRREDSLEIDPLSLDLDQHFEGF